MNAGLAFLFGWCFLLSLSIVSVSHVALNRELYASFYKKEQLDQKLNVPDNFSYESLVSLLDYIEGNSDSIHPVFNEKEVQHMKDVKGLYDVAMGVKWGCLAGMLGIAGYFYCFHKKHIFSYLSRGLLQSSLCFFVCILVLGMWAFTDFTDFWYRIHTLVFSNNLWILDPAEDFMILICPESLFSTICLRAGILFSLVLTGSLAASIWYLFKKSVIGFDQIS